MTPSRRMEGVRAYDRAADAFGVAAWKTPPARRVEARSASAVPETMEPTFRDMVRALPEWALIVGGGVIAAMMGAMLGGALHI